MWFLEVMSFHEFESVPYDFKRSPFSAEQKTTHVIMNPDSVASGNGEEKSENGQDQFDKAPPRIVRKNRETRNFGEALTRAVAEKFRKLVLLIGG